MVICDKKGKHMGLHLTRQMLESIYAGKDIFYTDSRGNDWLISECEGKYGNYAVFDGHIPMFGYSTIEIAKEAIETESLYWKGEGWYLPIAFNWESERVWCCTPEEVKRLETDTAIRFPDRPIGVEYKGSEGRPDDPYDSIRRYI